MPLRVAKKKRGNRQSSTGRSSNVTIRTPTQAFAASLAVRSDQSRLLGKTVVFVSTTPNPIGSNINPSFLGARPTAYAALFAKWRINRLFIRPLNTSASAGVNYTGVFDDTSTSADVPTSASDVIDLRCSNASNFSVFPEAYNEIQWSPPRGPRVWYFTTLEGSSSDPRLEVPCSLWVGAGTTAVSNTYEISYDLSFIGAVDTLSAP